jgi:hypothetical protein
MTQSAWNSFAIVATFCALSALPAAAEEQSWSTRAKPPVKFAPSPTEQKTQDWSGFHMGVNAGGGFKTQNRDSALPPGMNPPR